MKIRFPKLTEDLFARAFMGVCAVFLTFVMILVWIGLFFEVKRQITGTPTCSCHTVTK